MRHMAPVQFTFAYTGIRVRDLDRSLAFCQNVIGMTLLRRVADPMTKGEYAILKSLTSEDELEINWYSAESPVAKPYPGHEGEELDHLASEVKDLEEALSHLEAQGYPPVMGPTVDEAFGVAYVADPDGIWVEIYQKRL